MLTGRSALEDRVRGLEGGADVYMTKPVDLLELSSVIRSLARRMRLAKAPRPADAETRAAADSTWSLQDGGWIGAQKQHQMSKLCASSSMKTDM